MSKKEMVKQADNESELSPDQYREILKGIELQGMVLKTCKTQLYSIEIEKPANITINNKSKFQPKENKVFLISDFYSLSAKAGKKKIFQIDLEYSLTFNSKIDIDERFFKIYSRKNLRLNTYPFVREIVLSLTGRMGMPPLVLPLLK